MTPHAPDNLAKVKAEMAKAAHLAGRDLADVTLIAVSKTFDGDAIRPAIAAGQRHFGENRVQEAEGKWPELKAETPDVTLHMIGQLQSNKAEDAVALFDVIHSVDRPSLAKALSKAMEKLGRRLPCFVQVNVGDEEQKGGVALDGLPAFLSSCRGLGLDIAGLMCIPPADEEPAPYFALLAKLARDQGLTQLSMGMSGDYPVAIQLGATHVRVGSAIFGAR